MTRSAEAPLWVGIWLNARTRSLPPSAMNRRVPVERANRGKFSVALQDLGYVGLPLVSVPFETVQSTGVCFPVVSTVNPLSGVELVRSGWPIAKSAGALLLDG